MKRITILLILIVLFLIGSRPVEGEPQQDRPTRTGKAEFQQFVAVNYILLDVIVTDGDGNYIRNLSASDFEISENGKRVDVESIDEYSMLEPSRLNLDTLEPAQLEQPPRTIIFFIDRLYSSSNGLARAIDMAEKFILDRVQTGDRVMVVSYQGSLRTVQPFTSDKYQVIESMRKAGFATDSSVAASALPEGAALGQTPGLGGETDLEGEPGEGIETALNAMLDSDFAIYNARNYLLSMEALGKVMKYYPGRKTMIVLSEGMNWDMIDPTDRNAALFGADGPYRNNANTGEVPARMQFSLTTEYEKMLETMNDSKVSFYTVNVGGIQAPGGAENNIAQTDSVTRQVDMAPGVSSRRKRQNFLSVLANETGGRAYFNTNDILGLLNNIEIDISNYYILGYRSQFNPNKSEYRKIVVKTTQPGLKVLHRQGFYTPRPFSSFSKDERDMQLTEGFLTHSELNDLAAVGAFHFVRPALDSLNTHVCIEVPIGELEARRGKVELEVLASNINDEGKIYSSAHKTYSLDLGKNPGAEGKHLRIVEVLDSDRGINRIRVALRDNMTGKRSFFYYNYMFSPTEEDELLLSQPLFYDPDHLKRSPGEFQIKVEELKNWNENRRGAADLLSHPRLGSFFPITEPEMGTDGVVHFIVDVFNLERTEIREGEISYRFALSPVPDEETVEREYYRITPTRAELSRMRTGSGVVIDAEFPLEGVPAGSYDLVVVVNDSVTGLQAASAGRLHVVE